jgi:hypothetical protein
MSETEIQRAHAALLKRIKAHLPQLLELQRQMNEAEDEGVYYYYHSDPRTYGLQYFSAQACTLFRQIASHDEGNLTLLFEVIMNEGTNRPLNLVQSRVWIQDAAPVITAYYHAKYFLNRHVRYRRELTSSPDVLPLGWAAILCLYGLR